MLDTIDASITIIRFTLTCLPATWLEITTTATTATAISRQDQISQASSNARKDKARAGGRRHSPPIRFAASHSTHHMAAQHRTVPPLLALALVFCSRTRRRRRRHCRCCELPDRV